MDPGIAIETPVDIPEPDYSDSEDSIPHTNIPPDPDLNPSTFQLKDPLEGEISMSDATLQSAFTEVDTDERSQEIPAPDYSEEEDVDQIEADHGSKTVVRTAPDAGSPSQSLDSRLAPTGDDGSGLISPKKLINPCLLSKEHAAIRQELKSNQRIGKNPTEKPELIKVLKERQEKEKKKAMEEYVKTKRTDLDIRLEEQAQKINQAEQLRHQELQEIKSEAEKPEFFKVHSKIIKTKSDS